MVSIKFYICWYIVLQVRSNFIGLTLKNISRKLWDGGSMKIKRIENLFLCVFNICSDVLERSGLYLNLNNT
jgi:hypothetical protein